MIKMIEIIVAFTGGGAALDHIFKDKAGNSPISNIPETIEVPNELLFSFFLLSDLHISVDESIMTKKLHAALQDIVAFESPVDMIFLGGDLTDFGRVNDYRLLREILDAYTLPPMYANMGNHDYYDIWLDKNGVFSTETLPNGKTDAMARERFMKFFEYTENPYIDLWVGDVHLILLSQEAYVGEKPEYGEGAWYSDEQLAWFEQIMKQHEDGKPAFVFIHQPLPAADTDGRTHQLIRAQEFRAILKPYRNVFVLSGHTHRNFTTENHYNTQNTFHWFNNASVGRTRNTQNSKVAQGMYVQVYTKEVIIRGREFSDRSWIDSASWTVPLL